MSQQRYLQQLRSSVQNNKESAINAIQTQLGKANDGSFVLGRYFDAKNGVRTVIGVNARTTNGSAMAIFEFDKIEQEQLIERIGFIETIVGISEGDGSKSITERVNEIEKIINDLLADEKNTNSVAYKIYQSEEKLIGDKFTDTADSDTIEGAKKYADKAIEEELKDGGKIETAIEKAQAAATTKVSVSNDVNNVLTITPKTNADNSTTYEVSLSDIATQAELDEVKDFIGMTEGGDTTTIIDRIETVNDRVTDEVEALEQKITENKNAITVLNGTGEGSVHKTVSDAITNLVNGADEQFDTLKEIADYIANDTTNAAQITNNISDLQKTVNALGKTNIVSCPNSDLIKVTTAISTNSDSKEEKTFTVCANGIASVDDLQVAKTEFQNSITQTNTLLQKEITDRQTEDNRIESEFENTVTIINSEIDTLETKINNLLGNSATSVDGRIDAAVKKLKGDATIAGDNLGLLEDRIEKLEDDVNTTTGKVQTAINTAVNSLDYTDTPKGNMYISSINQTDGKISVGRTLFENAVVSNDGKTLSQKFIEINQLIEQAEDSAKSAISKVTVSGNDMLTKTESVDSTNGSVTYDINLSNIWDCGEFVYEEPEANEEN